MRTLILIFILWIILPVYCFQTVEALPEKSRPEFNNLVVQKISDQAILSKIIGRKCLYFSEGHHGHIWSLAVKDPNGYIIFSGNTRNQEFRIDTITHSNPIISWGLDSLGNDRQPLTAEKQETNWNLFERLVLFSKDSEVLFECTNFTTYIGVESKVFKEKLKALKSIMLWYALPLELQKLMPKPT